MDVSIGGFDVYINTDRFEGLSLESQDILSQRMHQLSCVTETCSVNGWLKINLDSVNELQDALAQVRSYLSPEIAKGERVEEVWSDVSGYSYRYHRGSFSPCSVEKGE